MEIKFNLDKESKEDMDRVIKYAVMDRITELFKDETKLQSFIDKMVEKEVEKQRNNITKQFNNIVENLLKSKLIKVVQESQYVSCDTTYGSSIRTINIKKYQLDKLLEKCMKEILIEHLDFTEIKKDLLKKDESKK